MKPFNVFPYDSKIDFMGLRIVSMAIAALVMFAGIGAMATKGFNFALDFTGGVGIELRFATPVEVEELRGRLARVGFDGAQVQNFGTGNDVLVRLQEKKGEAQQGAPGSVAQEVRQAVSTPDNPAEIRTSADISAQVGKELALNGIWALVFVVIGFLIYISFRFELKFAVAAIIAVKYSNQGISPVFACTLRSVITSICGVIYCIRKKKALFHTDIRLFHGFMVGLLFGLEFACIYFGMLYTDAARSVVFAYLSPFVVAVGAHFFLKGDRLSFPKIAGLILAFAGIVTVFGGRPKTAKTTMVLGDLLEIAAAFLWGATTLYIKKFMAEKVHPIHTFLYQLFFSIPILLIGEPHP